MCNHLITASRIMQHLLAGEYRIRHARAISGYLRSGVSGI
jgi:hypothetical protein